MSPDGDDGDDDDRRRRRRQPKHDRNRIVTLNVGGEQFATRISTLTDAGDSYFAKMLSGPFEHGDDFIDRDPILFRDVLHFLRTRTLLVPEGADHVHVHRALLEEALYFNLTNLADRLRLLIASANVDGRSKAVIRRRPDEQQQQRCPGDAMGPVATGPIRFDDFDF